MPRKRSSKDKTGHASQDRLMLTQEKLLLALEDCRPSVSEKERNKYSKM